MKDHFVGFLRFKTHLNCLGRWYGMVFIFRIKNTSTIHNRNMSFKKKAGFALLSKHLQSVAVFQRGPVNN